MLNASINPEHKLKGHMSKTVPFNPEPSELEILKKNLSEKYHSYILITCSSPSVEGNMDVEMSCSGDPDLLEYLMDGARHRLG